MDKVQKPSDSEWYAPSSETFRFYRRILYTLFTYTLYGFRVRQS
jgi:hypothetical protein